MFGVSGGQQKARARTQAPERVLVRMVKAKQVNDFLTSVSLMILLLAYLQHIHSIFKPVRYIYTSFALASSASASELSADSVFRPKILRASATDMSCGRVFSALTGFPPAAKITSSSSSERFRVSTRKK